MKIFKYSFLIKICTCIALLLIWELLSLEIPPTRPDVHELTDFIIHNLTKEDISVPEKSLLGRLKICSLRKNVLYKPMFCSKTEFDQCAGQRISFKNYEQRRSLCNKLSGLLNMKSNIIQERQIAKLHKYQEKQIFITKLVHRAGIQPAFLPQNVRGRIKLDFKKCLKS